jgi:uncharacterized protein YaaW (UPF0174 family)
MCVVDGYVDTHTHTHTQLHARCDGALLLARLQAAASSDAIARPQPPVQLSMALAGVGISVVEASSEVARELLYLFAGPVGAAVTITAAAGAYRYLPLCCVWDLI